MAPNESTTDRRIDIDNYDGRKRRSPLLSVEMGTNSATLALRSTDPRPAPEEIEAARETKTINQYTLAETSSRSRSGSASSMNHRDVLFVLVRDGDDWTCVSPDPMPRPNNRGGDYLPTQVPGVSVTTLLSTQGGRGSESRSQYRYKIEREVVESHDEVSEEPLWD